MTKSLAVVSLTYEAPEQAECAFGYAQQLALFLRDPATQLLDCRQFSAPYSVHWSRSLSVAICREMGVDYALHWDTDVVPENAGTLCRDMLATGHDLIGASYPRKRIHWDKAKLGGQATAYEYPYRFGGGQYDGVQRPVEVVGGCIEVDSMPFGFMLVSKRCMDLMWSAYEEQLWYSYRADSGEFKRGVYLFGETWSSEQPGPDGRPWRTPLSEDYSFCERWRQIGGRVMMYVGPGSPAAHVGGHCYKGSTTGLLYGG